MFYFQYSIEFPFCFFFGHKFTCGKKMGNQQPGNNKPPTKADLINTRKSILDFSELNDAGELV